MRRPRGTPLSLEFDTLESPGPMPTPCRVWRWSLDRHGYGQMRHSGTTRRAHRVAYELLRGPIPLGLTLDHLCRNRACVNPDHLEPVSLAENILRGNGMSARHARRTHCDRGHALVEIGRGLRGCKECRKSWGREYQKTPQARAAARAWRENNPDKIKELKHTYYLRHSEEVKQRVREYRANNIEAVREQAREYSRRIRQTPERKEYMRAYAARKKAERQAAKETP